jgi:hypothetical protein
MADMPREREPSNPAPSAFERVATLGTAAQASVPGIYAWGVTVAPGAWARGAGLAPKAAALVGLSALLFGAVTERRFGSTVRHGVLWTFALSSVLVWLVVPAALGPSRIDPLHGVIGVLAWGLFGFAAAAPTLRARGADPESPTVATAAIADAPLRPRAGIRRGDAAYVLGGAAAALALQAIGWKVVVPERALLVRLVTLAAGIAVLGAATSLAMARHSRNENGRAPPLTQVQRLRRATFSFVLFLLLAAAGLLFILRG